MVAVENDTYRFEIEYGAYGYFVNKATNESVYKEWPDIKHRGCVPVFCSFLTGLLILLNEITISDWPEEFKKCIEQRQGECGIPDSTVVINLFQKLIGSVTEQGVVTHH